MPRPRRAKYQLDQDNPQLPYPGLVDQVREEGMPPPPPPAAGPTDAPIEAGAGAGGHRLFDLDRSEYTLVHHQIEGARIGDRMLLALGLDVSPRAKVVAAGVAYFASRWTGWPSRATIAALTGIAPPHVSNAFRELNEAGVMSRLPRTGPRGAAVFQTSFAGAAIVETAIRQAHPALGIAALEVLRAVGTNTVPTAPHVLKGDPENGGSRYQYGTYSHAQVGTDMVPRTGNPEPGGTLIDVCSDSEKTNQSNPGPGSGYQPSVRELEDPADLPLWYQAMTDLADPERFPRYADIAADADAHGWDAVVLEEAAERYRGHYGVQTHYDQPAPRISDPLALFRKLAEDVVQHLVRVGPLPPAPGHLSKWMSYE